MKALKRWMAAAMAVALLGVAPGAFAQVGPFYYNFTAVDENNVPYVGQNVNCSITRPQQHGYVTLHSSSALLASSGGTIWSDVNGRLHFYTSLNVPVDVQCFYAGGGSFTGRLRHTDHKIIIPRQGLQVARFAVSTSAATYQSNSGIVIPGGSLVYDVIVQNNNPQGLGTYHLNVGFLGNHAIATSNSLGQVALNSPDEWLRPHMVVTSGVNVAGDFSTWVNHRGVALRRAHGAGAGFYAEVPYLVHVGTGLSVSYSAQPGAKLAAGSNFVVAHVFILFKSLHSVSNSIGFGLGQ